MKRGWLIIGACASSLVAWIGACRVTPLQVGEDPPDLGPDVPDASAPDVHVVDAGAPLTFEEKLRARCAEEPGQNNAYYSALELTQRIVGRWFLCDPASMSSLNDDEGDGFAFDADGTWAVLRFDDARGALVPETKDDYNFGKVRYHSFADADAGAAADAGVVSQDVARDDPRPRTSLVVYLDRRGMGLGPDPHGFAFSKNPRQMEVVEYGPSPLRARFVPVD
ncbi:MAG: hypothetical protein KF819_33330 [Labilithrix sp.]|nr:hypothetical protein [Labilithrix sp.]